VCFLVLSFANARFFGTQSGMICFASPIGAFFPTSWWRRTCTQIFPAHRRPGRGCAAPRETHFIEKHEHNDKIKPQFQSTLICWKNFSTQHPSVTSLGKCLEHLRLGCFLLVPNSQRRTISTPLQLRSCQGTPRPTTYVFFLGKKKFHGGKCSKKHFEKYIHITLGLGLIPRQK